MNGMPSPTPAMLAGAQELAARGFRMIPLRDADKRPRITGWVNAATSDPHQIARWWGQHPRANVGMVTGEHSKVWVLDIDDGGQETLDEMVKRHGQLPTTVEVRTGSGGRHIWFAYPRTSEKVTSRSKVLPGIDVRGQGGQVVVPPSIHPVTGEPYTWIVHPDEVAQLPDAPTWLLQIVQATAPLPKPLDPIADGERDAAATSFAWKLAWRVVQDNMPEAAAMVQLVELVNRCERSVPPHEMHLNTERFVRAKLKSAIRKAASQDEGELSAISNPSFETAFSDMGNAYRFRRLVGHRVRYVVEWKSWIALVGPRWTLANGPVLAFELTEEVACELHREAGDRSATKEHRDAAHRAFQKAQSTSAREHMVKAARGKLAISHHDLDQHPILLNTPTGTVDLQHPEAGARPHDPGDLLTQVTGAAYDPTATCPRFDRFLREVLPDEQDRAYLQRLVGYSTTGVVREHVLVALLGRGGNGKTTLVSALGHALGDYHGVAAPELLLKRTHRGHPTEIADLYGKRFVSDAEIGIGSRLDEGLVKRLTGGDVVKARRMREDPWSFKPTAKFWLLVNDLPEILGTDDGIWRRIILIKFGERFLGSHADPMLTEKLRAESSGILRWCIEGARQYLEDGLPYNSRAEKARDVYRNEQDSLGRFLDECCTCHEDDAWVLLAEFRRAYESWCASNGTPPPLRGPTSKAAMEARGFRQGKKGTRSGARAWLGVALVDPGRGPEDREDSPSGSTP